MSVIEVEERYLRAVAQIFDLGTRLTKLEAENKVLREASQQALHKLEHLRVTIDREWGECRTLEEIDADGVQWSEVLALRAALAEPEPRNQCGETCERAKLCAVCAGELAEQQEPFGYFRAEPFGWTDCAEMDEGAVALFTAPPQRKPLSDREVGAIMERLNAHGTRLWEFARAIECAHGIAEKSQTVTNEQLIEHVRQFMAFYGLEEKK